jgi:FixJ family two-component response regulator
MKDPIKDRNNTLAAIVDDDVYVCEAVESLLKSIGFRTATFNSARDFLDSPEFSNVSCLILDVSMPVMNGLELQRHLADKPFTFSHELVRQTLLAGISNPRRQHLHAGVADAIARLQGDAVNERAGYIATP